MDKKGAQEGECEDRKDVQHPEKNKYIKKIHNPIELTKLQMILTARSGAKTNITQKIDRQLID